MSAMQECVVRRLHCLNKGTYPPACSLLTRSRNVVYVWLLLKSFDLHRWRSLNEQAPFSVDLIKEAKSKGKLL